MDMTRNGGTNVDSAQAVWIKRLEVHGQHLITDKCKVTHTNCNENRPTP